MQDKGDFHFIIHQFLPSVQVLYVPRESIDQEATALETCLIHSPLQQHDSDLTRYDLSLNYVLLNDLAILRSRLLPFRPQQIASRQMHELELLLYPFTQGPLACTWPTQDEDHRCIFLTHQQISNDSNPFNGINEGSKCNDFRRPSDIRGHVVQTLYGLHVPPEITVFIAKEIIVSCQVDKGKASDATLRYQIIEDLSLGLIEVVVEDRDGDVTQVGGLEDLAEREVHVR